MELENGFLSFAELREHGYREKVKYGCSDPYVLDGPSEIECEETGTWSSIPVCRGTCCHAYTLHTTRHTRGVQSHQQRAGFQSNQAGGTPESTCVISLSLVHSRLGCGSWLVGMKARPRLTLLWIRSDQSLVPGGPFLQMIRKAGVAVIGRGAWICKRKPYFCTNNTKTKAFICWAYKLH